MDKTLMNINYTNFVGIYENAVSDKFCTDLIEYFEYCKANNMTFGRPEAEQYKKDTSVLLNAADPDSLTFKHTQLSNFIGEFNDVFWNKFYADYIDKYASLTNDSQHTIYSYKVQKTLPAGGYHIWHCEDGSKEFSFRVGTYILYLNDVEEGGETEFLYQSMRIKPKRGTLVIFPPNYPWTHRGNPPLSGEKYILTGWTEYT